MSDLDAIFSADGALARVVEGFRVRACQLDFARAVADAIEARSVLVAEAGTGTGKTFAYLVPALRSGGKVIISTGTKTLQDQLFDRDIPKVRNALKVPVSVALLKGRANYVCHHHLQRAVTDGRFLNREDVRDLHAIERFSRTTLTGDRADCDGVPENAPVWSQVTSTRENCLGSDCGHFDRCFVMKARKQALDADVVVVNHHLFFADVMLRDEGVGELLPACNTVILDEAHQVPETATVFFGESLSTVQLVTLAREIVLEAAVAAKDSRALPDAARAVDKAARDFRLVFTEETGRMPLRALEKNTRFQEALGVVIDRLGALCAELEQHGARSDELQRCHDRALQALDQAPALARRARRRSREMGGALHPRRCNCIRRRSRSPRFSRGRSKDKRAHGCSRRRRFQWRATSRTTVHALGLKDARTASWDSPFSYDRQALLYVPPDMPEPNTPEYTRAVVEAALPLIEASGGRAFLLFTSLRAMRDAQWLLHDALKRRHLDLPVLVQGERPRTELLERFRRLGNAILIGSQSFWEGVDVKGEALSLVVIDKLPFSAPDDPVLAARIDKMNREGRNAFLEYQLAAGGHHVEARRRTADPRRDRSRRADDLRPAAFHEDVRPPHPSKPAADAAHAQSGRRDPVPGAGVECPAAIVSERSLARTIANA